VAFLGSTVVGAPIVGWVGEHVDPRASFYVGAAAAFAAGVIGLMAARRSRQRRLENAKVVPAPFARKEEFE